MSLQIARVVASHPTTHTVDVELVASGARLAGVRVMSPSAGGDHGVSGLPFVPGQDGDGRWTASPDPARAVLAVVAQLGPLPVVMGFLFPPAAQMLFAERDRMVWRHPSDVYVTVSGVGDVEIAHPSGAYLRIGEATAHEDLSGADAAGAWAIAKNTDRAAGFRVAIGRPGSEKAAIELSPDGAVSITATGALTVHAAGDMALTTDGKMDITSAGPMKLQGQTIDLN